MRILSVFIFAIGLNAQTISSITHSESASTSIIQWTTDTASNSSVACGLVSGGPYGIAGVDDGVQTAVTAHYDIVAGLQSSTIYFCKVTSGATTSSEFSFTTLAAPSSNPIVGLQWTGGEPRYNLAWPSHWVDGDTLNNAECANGTMYVGMNDTHNFDGPVTGNAFTNACGATGTSNQSISSYAGSPFVGTLINAMSGFLPCNTTDTDGATGKQDTLFCINDQWNSDTLFMHTTRQGGSPNFARLNGGLLKSADHGASWANWVSPSTFLANGAPPSPITSNMLGSTNNPSGKFSSVLAIMYQPAGGTSPRVDNQDAYIYWTVPNAGSVYLMRVPRSKIANLSGTDYQYYIGPDGTFDSSWSTSSSGASTVYSNPGHLDTAPVQHVSTLNRYLMWTSYYTIQPSESVWIVLEAPHPWGPWKSVYVTTWNPQGYVDFRFLAHTMSTAALTATGNSFQGLFVGDYTTDPPGMDLTSSSMFYQLHTGTVKILTGTPATTIQGQVSISGSTTIR